MRISLYWTLQRKKDDDTNAKVGVATSEIKIRNINTKRVFMNKTLVCAHETLLYDQGYCLLLYNTFVPTSFEVFCFSYDTMW